LSQVEAAGSVRIGQQGSVGVTPWGEVGSPRYGGLEPLSGLGIGMSPKYTGTRGTRAAYSQIKMRTDANEITAQAKIDDVKVNETSTQET
jgi:hypothetical protein